LADVCGYELPTNLTNFTQKDLTEVKILQKVLGGYFFLKHPVHQYHICSKHNEVNVLTASGCDVVGHLAYMQMVMHWPRSTRMGDHLWAGKPSWYVTSQLAQLSLLPSMGL